MPVTNRADSSAASVELDKTSTADTGTPASIASHSGKKRKAAASSRGVASLTPDQLEKKRANDREAQRAIRERTKNQIETLERRIRDLTAQKPFQELQEALRQKEAVQAENDEIRSRLSSILSIIQPVLGAQGLTDLATSTRTQLPQNPATWRKDSSNAVQNYAYPHNPDAATVLSGPTFSDSSSLSVETPSPRSAPPARQHDQSSLSLGAVPESSWSPFDSQKNNLAHGLDFGGSGERLGLGFLLDGSQQVTKLKDIHRPPEPVGPYGQYPGQHANIAERHMVAHAAPCRNIAPTCPLDGILLDFLHSRQREAAEGASTRSLVGPAYPSVSSLLNPEKSIYSHPLSKVFTDVLSKFPDISSLPEQVAVLYIMFLIMRWQIYPTQENYDRLPDWATPRPSQLFTPHPAWLDYLPWPRMRDKMVATYQNYPFENWFIPYTTTLSLNWPYEPTDCLLSSSESDELMINPVFERHLRNLHNWSLGAAWARAFPELVETARIKGDTRRTSDDVPTVD